MVLKNTNQLLSNGGEALFAAVYGSPYFNIYDQISKKEKWGKYMHDVKNLLPKFPKLKYVSIGEGDENEQISEVRVFMGLLNYLSKISKSTNIL